MGLLLAGVLTGAFLLGSNERANTRCTGINVTIKDSLYTRFITEKAVEEYLTLHYKGLVGMPLDSIDLYRIEETLNSNSAILKDEFLSSGLYVNTVFCDISETTLNNVHRRSVTFLNNDLAGVVDTSFVVSTETEYAVKNVTLVYTTLSVLSNILKVCNGTRERSHRMNNNKVISDKGRNSDVGEVQAELLPSAEVTTSNRINAVIKAHRLS
jgi:hypothetical protein